MLFETHDQEHRLVANLERLATAVDRSDEVGQLLVQKGYGLLDVKFGGVIGGRDCELDPLFLLFEKELLKERFAAWAVLCDQGLVRLGYKSRLLDTLLSSIAVFREELEDLSRSSDSDQAIESAPWAWRYARSHLESVRATYFRDLVSQEKTIEASRRGLQYGLSKRVLKKHATSTISSALSDLGFRKTSKTYGRFTATFSNLGRGSSGVPLEIALSFDSVPFVGFPFTLQVHFMPLFDLAGAKEVLLRSASHGAFFKRIEALVPNFGLYSVAWNEAQFMLMLSAYEDLIRAIVPLIEEVIASRNEPRE